jgi:prolyl oligopeptidase
MYIVKKKSLEMDGQNGTILYGYGGFNIADMPSFSVSRLLFVHHFGGISAMANLRGGRFDYSFLLSLSNTGTVISEYGEKWHEAGMRENKQNVFDDFIAAAEYLVKEKYTSPEKYNYLTLFFKAMLIYKNKDLPSTAARMEVC